MIVLGLNSGHDSSAALTIDGELVAYCKEERLTRSKQDSGKPLHQAAIEEVLLIAGVERSQIDAIALDRGRLPSRCFVRSSDPLKLGWRKAVNRTTRILGELSRLGGDELDIVDGDRIRSYLGVSSSAQIVFVNHHYSHVLGSFNDTEWRTDALYIAIDAGGDNTCHAAYGFDGEQLRCLYGGDEFLSERKYQYAASIGIAYSLVTKLLGFKANRHEGKITGLAAFGTPIIGDEICDAFTIEADGNVVSPFESVAGLEEFLKDLIKTHSREDVAASIQYALEKHVTALVQTFRSIYPSKYLGLSGGVFANVRLNQKVAELPGVEEIFVMPPMGDEGLSVGNCFAAEISLNGGVKNLPRGRPLNAYYGRAYSGEDLFAAAQRAGCETQSSEDPASACAVLLSQGRIGAIYAARMEMGPRALGARSIIASPADARLNDDLNRRLTRTEFMPFAPYVRDCDAQDVFDIDDRNREACRFMTVTVDVKPSWRDKIPAVVHVDGTARPQLVQRASNPLYYDILTHFKEITGLPCLVNTSFNAHEEPIINTPQEAVVALMEKRIDFLVCDEGLVVARS